MQFTPELEFQGGRVRPLTNDDIDRLFEIYQAPEIPEQRPLEDKNHCQRMVELSQQMAATQRGMMWLLENTEQQCLGVVSIYDWQPSLLKATIRVDGLPTLPSTIRAEAIKTCIQFMNEKYHIRNVAFQWVEGQSEELIDMIKTLGFTQSARLRESWRTAQNTFRDVIHFHYLIQEPSE